MWKVFSHHPHRHHHYRSMYKDYGVQIVWAFAFVSPSILAISMMAVERFVVQALVDGKWARIYCIELGISMRNEFIGQIFRFPVEFHSHNYIDRKAIFHHKIIWLIQSFSVLAGRKKRNELFISNNNENPSVSRVNIWIKLYSWFRFGFGCGCGALYIRRTKTSLLFVAFVPWHGRMSIRPKIKTNKIECWNDTITLNGNEFIFHDKIFACTHYFININFDKMQTPPEFNPRSAIGREKSSSFQLGESEKKWNPIWIVEAMSLICCAFVWHSLHLAGCYHWNLSFQWNF